MMKLADIAALKAAGNKRPYRFKSDWPHQKLNASVVECIHVSLRN